MFGRVENTGWFSKRAQSANDEIQNRGQNSSGGAMKMEG
jgi:hypothetical protein